MVYDQSKQVIAAVLCCSLCAVVLSTAAAQAADPRTGKQINWHEYITSAGLVSAIASALSYVDHCSKPIVIEEYRISKHKRQLAFTCNGREDEEGSVFLTIERFSTKGPWMPKSFDRAG